MGDLGSGAIQAFLFGLFAGLTGILAAITGPTYDGLVVPEMQPGALYPSLSGGGASYLTLAVQFSDYLVANLVDPATALVGVALAVTFLARAMLGRSGRSVEPLLGRLVLAVLLANFTLPLSGAILDLAGATYPVLAGWDGGVWQHWVNLAGWGELQFSWDNGALAFIITFALFALVLGLAAAIALRDALLGVLLVLLPVLTLLWPIPTLAPLARRAWLWYGELSFLPCVVVVPLELAVHTPTVLLLLGYLTAAIAAPAFLSVAERNLASLGFTSAGSAVGGALQRGLATASRTTSSYVTPAARLPGLSPEGRAAAGSAGRAFAGASFPASLPIAAGEFLGMGTVQLAHHLARVAVPQHRFNVSRSSAASSSSAATSPRSPPSGGPGGG